MRSSGEPGTLGDAKEEGHEQAWVRASDWPDSKSNPTTRMADSLLKASTLSLINRENDTCHSRSGNVSNEAGELWGPAQCLTHGKGSIFKMQAFKPIHGVHSGA